MATKEEIAILLASISKQMTQQGQLIRKMWVEMTGLAPTADDLKPKKEMPKKEEPKEIVKKKNVPKIPANGKIPLSYKIAKKGCKWCDGIVAWPRVFVTDEEVAAGKIRQGPIHCDIDGNIKGDGRCPNL